jgi:uncharacterized protein (DUF2141 family)
MWKFLGAGLLTLLLATAASAADLTVTISGVKNSNGSVATALFNSESDAGGGPRRTSSASMEKIAHILDEKHAQLWINHDKPSSDARRHAPEFHE